MVVMTLSKKWLIALSLSLAVSGYFYWGQHQEKKKFEYKQNALSFAKESVSHRVVTENDFPTSLKYQEEDFKVSYTINWDLQAGIEKILKRYANDHSAVVVINNNTGEIMAVAGIEREERRLNFSLPFTSTHPSASLFKIITTADLLSSDKIQPSTKLNYRGRGTTLYKYQLKNKVSRWTRWISFKKAFAYSNNVIFGKAAIQKSSGHSIFKKAFNFGFNRQLMFDFNLGPSRFIMPESQYQLAEMASGFNKKTMISPVHAAVLSSIVASGGYFQSPYIIDSISNAEESFYYPKVREKILDDQTVKDMKQMMSLTVSRGTARGMTRGRSGRRLKKKYDLGAKTGSITGGIPFGKRDWLSFYARPKNRDKDLGVSVAIMNVNGKRWYYKSSFLAKQILKLINSLDEKVFASNKKNLQGKS